MVKTKCDFCGAEIKVKPSKMKKFRCHFCNISCHNRWLKDNSPKGKNSPHWKEKVVVRCMFCGKEFKKQGAWVKRTKMHFCSRDCLHSWKREHPKKGKKSVRWNSELVSCAFCGKKFYLPQHRLLSKHHFCSNGCHFSWIRANPKLGKDNPMWNRVKVFCSNCGKEFYEKPSRIKMHKNHFCNKKCYNLWQKQQAPRGKNNKFWNRVELSCSYCGKIIERTPNRVKQFSTQFCDRNCFTQWKKENLFGKNNPCWNRVDISCAFCGKEIFVKKSRSKKTTFCSRECFISWKKETSVGKNNPNYSAIKTICDFCGKEIYKEKSKYKRHKHHFCSNGCCSKWEINNTPKGENNPQWKGGGFPYYGDSWAKNRRIALETAGFKSEISNIPAKTVHHIMPLKSFIEHAFDLFLYHIPGISFESFKILPYDLLIPDIFFDEANDIGNLIVLTSSEHPRYEGEPLSFFEEIRNAC